MYHKKYAIKNWHVQYNAMEYTLILSRSFPSLPHSPPFPTPLPSPISLQIHVWVLTRVLKRGADSLNTGNDRVYDVNNLQLSPIQEITPANSATSNHRKQVEVIIIIIYGTIYEAILSSK